MSIEEAKIHYERKQLERQQKELLNPLQKQQQRGKGGKGSKGADASAFAKRRIKESYDLLDCMDDLLLQITILRDRITALQR